MPELDPRAHFASVGHADDLLTWSFTQCGKCCSRHQQGLLPPDIGYELKAVGPTLRFLHTVLTFTPMGVVAVPRNPNVAFAYGDAAVHTHVRGRPNVGFGGWAIRINFSLPKKRLQRAGSPEVPPRATACHRQRGSECVHLEKQGERD